ncbi:MAG: cation diffusion facilitator family transporter [Clostridiales Family XIII bacterium]|jgi:cation diffusion facilitator family transporter|nr:cation diffusion facilitator family transporter [Clostridiales Family XIII bacterium]
MELLKKNKAIVAAMCANFIVALMKFIVSAISGSASMFSEAIHSAADTMNQIVLLIGKKRAEKVPDQKHPFGYARSTFFASFIVASFLFFIGGAFSLFEAIEKIGHIVQGSGLHGLERNSMIIAAAILFVSIGLEVFSLRTAIREVREEQRLTGVNTGLWRFYRDTNNASLIVIVTEDLAAVIGLSLALAGVLATLATGNPLFDAIGGAAVGALLIVAAFVLGKEIASLIIGESLRSSKLKEIEKIAESAPHVKKCHRIKSDALGSDAILIEMDIEFEDAQSLSTGEAILSIELIKRGIKNSFSEEGIYVSTCVEPVRAEKYEELETN